MDIKKFKHDVNIEELEIPELSKDVIDYSKRNKPVKETKERINFTKLFRKSLVFAPLIIMILIVVISMTGSGYSYSCKMQTIKNERDLQKVLNFERKKLDFNFNFDIDGEFAPGADSPNGGADGEPGGASPEGGGSNEEIDFSETNTQEKGVDEADIIKTDGKKIYYLSAYQKHLYTYDVSTNEVKKEYFGNQFSDGTLYGIEMYLSEKYIVVTAEYTTLIENDNPNSYYKYENHVAIQLYEKDTLKLVKKYENKGEKIDSRKVENTLYYVYTQTNVDKLPSDKIDNKENKYQYQDINYSQTTINEGYTYIVSVDLNTLDIKTKIQLGANNWTTVYATKDSIYLAVTNTFYRLNKYSINGIPEEIGASSQSGNITTIFRYELNGLDVNYKGVIISRGAVNDQFYLDEYDNHLRVVLQLGNNAQGNNKLEIYDLNQIDEEGKISKVASIDEGIGKPYESIKSVRFNDDSCLVVTYVQTDPLYYIDLTNQLEPKIIGEYEEPGYNTYLHYLTDTLAIGFGITDTGVGYYKMGLYVIENGTPNKVDEIDDYISLAPAQDHKALYIEDIVFGFQYGKYIVEEDGNYVGSGYDTFYGVYTIDTTGETPKFKSLYSKMESYNRMVRVEDKYYLFSDFGIQVLDNNFKELFSMKWF